MNLSSILVVTSQPHFESTVNVLTTFDGLEVHYCEPASSRNIVTQESNSTNTEMEGLQRIKALPHVILAEMVYHYCEEED